MELPGIFPTFMAKQVRNRYGPRVYSRVLRTVTIFHEKGMCGRKANEADPVVRRSPKNSTKVCCKQKYRIYGYFRISMISML